MLAGTIFIQVTVRRQHASALIVLVALADIDKVKFRCNHRDEEIYPL